MNDRWTLVKISKATRDRLERVRDSMLLADSVGLRNLERDNRDRVSLDQVVNLLIDLRERHAERRKRSASKRRKRKEESAEQGQEQGQEYWRVLLEASPDQEKEAKSIV